MSEEQLRFDDTPPAPWYGCDLDGTLAVSDGTHALGVIGAPVPKMVERVKQALAEGKDVRIFTARIADLTGVDLETEIRAIQEFCLANIGRVLPVTCTKDAGMVELWDDRVRQVEKNTGEFVVGRAEVQQPVAHKYGTTQADIPDGPAADAIEAVRALIADEDLAGQGKNVEGNHVTVRYGFFGNDCGSIASFLSKQKPFEAMLGKTEMFPATEHSDGAAVIKAPVISLDLRRINAQLAEQGPFKPSDFEYNPHATIAYVKPEVAEKYVGLCGTEGKTFKVDGITINKSNGQSLFVKLTGGNTTEFGPQGEPIITRYSEDQPRDDHGRFAAGGGSAQEKPDEVKQVESLQSKMRDLENQAAAIETGGKPGEQLQKLSEIASAHQDLYKQVQELKNGSVYKEWTAQQEKQQSIEHKAEIEKVVERTAKDMNYERVQVLSKEDSVYPKGFDVGGKHFNAGGYANLTTGQITIISTATHADYVPAILAHEIEHERFQGALNAYNFEHQALMKIPGDELFGRPGEPNTGVLRASGEVKPEYQNKYPVTTLLQKSLEQDKFKLYDSDGCTKYSEAYWKHYVDNGRKSADGERAMHETLAEIASVKVTTGKFPEKSTTGWRDLYRAVDKVAKSGNALWPNGLTPKHYVTGED